MAQKRKLFIYILIALLVGGVVWFIYSYRVKIGKILTPFFMALIIVYLVHPLVMKLERKKIKRRMAILLVYLFFSLAIITTTFFVIPGVIGNVKELIITLPQIVIQYEELFDKLITSIQSSGWPSDIKDTVFREIVNGTGFVQDKMMDGLRRILSGFIEAITALFDLVLAMIIAYYFINDGEFFKEAVLSLTPRKWRNGIIATGREINAILSNFIQGQLLTALIVGILETIGLIIIKAKYPLILGLVGGIANIIPYFGPILGAIPAVAIALIESPVKAIWTVIVFTIVQQIDNAFISPKIIEGKLGLHPVTTILAVLVGGEFFGILGMLVSVPIAAIIKVVVKRAVEAIV